VPLRARGATDGTHEQFLSFRERASLLPRRRSQAYRTRAMDSPPIGRRPVELTDRRDIRDLRPSNPTLWSCVVKATEFQSKRPIDNEMLRASGGVFEGRIVEVVQERTRFQKEPKLCRCS
jgi:hypothetical protein